MYNFSKQSLNKLLIGLVVVSMIVLISPNYSKASSKKVVVLHNFASSHLDPSLDYLPNRAGVTETLVKIDDDFEVKPGLATKWTSADNKKWVFTIRSNVKFHDGTVLTAKAVKDSLNRAMKNNPSVKSSLKIKSMSSSGQILTINTENEYPGLLSELVNPYTGIVSVASENKKGKEFFVKRPVGTGPFVVSGFTSNVEVKVSKFKAYWNGVAKIDEAVIKFNKDANVRTMALQSKEVDIAYQIPAENVYQVDANKSIRVASLSSLRVHLFAYNFKNPQLNDLKVRKAIDLLVDRDAIANTIMEGHASVANGPFIKNFSFNSKLGYKKINIKEARKLLTEAGYKLNSNKKLIKNGEELKLNIVTYQGRPELPLMAQVLQSNLGLVGISSTIKSVESVEDYLVKNADKWDIVTYSNVTAPRGDSAYYLNNAYTKDGVLNLGFYTNSNLSNLINQINKTNDQPLRNSLGKKASEIIYNEVPQSFVIHPNIIVGISTRVINWNPDQKELFILTNKMDVK